MSSAELPDAEVATDESRKDPFSRVVGRINDALHVVACVVLVVLMLLVVGDVIGRKFLSSPVPGSIELVELGLILIVYLGLGHAQAHGDHIAIDLVHQRLGARGKVVLAVLAQTVGVVVICVLAWRLLAYAEVLDAGRYRSATWGVPMSFLGYVAAAGAACFAAAMIATIVAELRSVRRGGAAA